MYDGWGKAGDGPAREDVRPDLSGFERKGDYISAPRGEQIENKFRRMALREDRATDTRRAGGRRPFPGFARGEQFRKCPAPPRRGVVQREFVAPFPGYFPPPFVKHCQFGNAALTSSASELMIPTKANSSETGARHFEFARDSFSFANELVWEYQVDVATGKRVFGPRNPK